jgi:outer membrane protein TolC
MHTFKNIYFYCYLIFIATVSSSGYSLSLEDALISSLESNYEIKIEESNLAASKENVTQSISNYFPSIALQGSISENEVTGIKSQTGSSSPGYDLEPSVVSITITQNLFNGLANYHSLIKAKTDEQSQKLLYENKKQEIILEALESYYNLLLA